MRFDEFFSIFQFFNFLKNFWRPFWAYLWLESKTMVFVRSSKVTNGWLVTIRDPESVIVTLQGYALQGYNGFLGVTYGYQFHWSLSRTLQMIHLFTFQLIGCEAIFECSANNFVDKWHFESNFKALKHFKAVWIYLTM